MKPSPEQIRTTLLAWAERRRPESTFCPSEIARTLAPANWRPLMPKVRAVAAELEAEGRLLWTQRGQRVDPRDARGPIRLRRP